MMIFLNKFATKTFCNFCTTVSGLASLLPYFLVADNGLQGSRRDQAGQAAPLLGQGGRQAEGAEPLQGLVPAHPLHV